MQKDFSCHPITAICFTLQRIATATRLINLELKFGMYA